MPPNVLLPAETNIFSAALVGKNKGHPAVFPVDLPAFFIKMLSPEGGLVVDPFGGSGTTGIAALSLSRHCVLIDNNQAYCKVAKERLKKEAAAKPEEIIVSENLSHQNDSVPNDPEKQIAFFEKAPLYKTKKTAK